MLHDQRPHVKVTIVTVVFNAVDQIESTVKSVLAQTYDNVEYVVIDGGSTDGTVEVLKRYSEQFAAFVSEHDEGIYDALNKGMSMATGDWVGILNAGDSFVSVDLIERLFDGRYDFSGVDVVYGDSISIDRGCEKYEKCSSDISRLRLGPTYRHGASFVRRGTQLRFPFDLSLKARLGFALDYEQIFRMFEAGCVFRKMPMPVIRYALRGVSTVSPFRATYYNYLITHGLRCGWFMRLGLVWLMCWRKLRATVGGRSIVDRVRTMVSHVFRPPVKDVARILGRDVDFRPLIIRRRAYGCGLFSYFITNLGWMRYAEEQGLTPVVDMRTHPTIYHAEGEVGRVNVWERFFCQPCELSLDEVSDVRRYSVADAMRIPGRASFFPDFPECENIELDECFLGWRRLVHKYVRIRLDVLDRYKTDGLEFELAAGRPVIGVLARGTDYVKLRPLDHPVQPCVNFLFDTIDRYSQCGHQDEKIFLATEDTEILKQFSVRFGTRLIVAKQSRPAYVDGLYGFVDSASGACQRGYEYLRAIYDLSRCSALIAGRTSGALGAALLSQGYSYAKLINLGRYQDS